MKLSVTRDEGVRTIAERMQSGTWKGAQSYAAEIGASLACADSWAAEAARQIRLAIPDEVYLDELRLWLERLAVSAEREGKWRDAIKAVEVMLGVRDRNLQRFEAAVRKVDTLSVQEKAERILADHELGPAVTNEVLRRRGLLIEGG